MKYIIFTALAVSAFIGGYLLGIPKTEMSVSPQPELAIVQEERGHVFYATATVYNMEESQTDSTPDICADGTKASYDKRIVAVSREQLERWGGKVKYGDKVMVTGTGVYDGVWNVHDTMNKRYGAWSPTHDRGVYGVVEARQLKPVKVDGVSHIDFLVPERLGKWENVKVEVIK
tara:strand:- start:712 stop:1233 length:522 start_codon:yes stop_codon:yes gene_type:complete